MSDDAQVPAGDFQDDPRSPRPQPTSQSASTELTRFADFEEQYITKYIRMADAKAGATLILSGGSLAYFVNDRVFRDDLKYNFLSLEWVAAAATTVLLALSTYFAFRVIAPRTPTSGQSVVFWRDIAGHLDAAVYSQMVRSLTADQMAIARLRHVFDLSKACNAKYEVLQRAMFLGIVGILAGALWAFFWQALPGNRG